MSVLRRLVLVFAVLAAGEGLILMFTGWQLSVFAALSIIAMIAATFSYLHVTIAAPIAALTARPGRLPENRGDICSRADDIGRIASALAAGTEADAETAAASQEPPAAKSEQTLDEEVEAFVAEISRALTRLRGHIGSIESSSSSLSHSATSAEGSASAARDASTKASENANTVLLSTQQLNASIGTITEQANTARTLVADLSDGAQASEREIGVLSEAAQQVGSIISLIRSVAQQTNLLALNATIEAARAGDAGRGFAVVADEVKALSAQTAKATEQIHSQIAEIQQKTAVAVDAIRGISAKLRTTNELVMGIASAVQEQGTATAEIANNIQHAADGSAKASTAADRVSEMAAETSSEADMLAMTSRDVSAVGDDIEKAVRVFIASVRGTTSDRRRADRDACTLDVVIESSAGAFDVKAIEASSYGFRVDRALPLAVGQQVRVTCDGFSAISRVVWVRADGVGFEKEAPGFNWRIARTESVQRSRA